MDSGRRCHTGPRMKGLLQDVQLSLNRAEAHLEMVRPTIRDVTSSRPYLITPHGPIRSGRYEIIFGQFLDEPPPGLGIMVGDCVHRLRTALDYLIVQIGRPDLGSKLNEAEF